MLRCTILTSLVVFCFGNACLPSLTQSEEIEVILLAGQSNMQGTGKKRDLPESFLEPLENVRFWNGTGFIPFDPNTTQTSARPSDLGPEIGFANFLSKLEPNKVHYLVKFYRSGQPLHHGWNRNRWEGPEHVPGRANFYPGRFASDPNIGQHYQDMMLVAESAFESLRASGHTPSLRGVIWMQGEQDSKHEVSATEYADSLLRFKSRIEEDLSAESVPFVMGQVLPFEPALDRFTHRVVIRQQQMAADMRSGSENAIEGCWCVPTDGMSLQEDRVHYDARGQILMGTAFAVGLYQAEDHLKMKRSGD